MIAIQHCLNSQWEILFGYPSPHPFCPPAFDAQSYPAHLQAKLAELHDWVESNLAAVAHKQKSTYDRHSTLPKFSVGDTVWLSIPTAGKLDSRWEGGWTVKSIKSPVNLEIAKGSRSKVIHTNRLRHRIQPSPTDLKKETTEITIAHWQPPTIDHQHIPPSPARRSPISYTSTITARPLQLKLVVELKEGGAYVE